MGFFVVPADYKEESHSSVIPICIADTDSEGNPVNPAWIERGVIPVADPLRGIAWRLLGDVWRVSEITEHAVHWHSQNDRAALLDDPSRHVLNYASWYAEDLRVGGRRARRMSDVALLATTLRTVREKQDPAADLLARDTVNRLLQALAREGLHDIRAMAWMMMSDCSPSDLESRFQKSRNTLSHRFFRVMRRVAASQTESPGKVLLKML